MRYLKTYEQINIKKYAIFSFEKFSGVLMIVEVVDVKDNFVFYKKRYTYRDYYGEPASRNLRETDYLYKDEIHKDSIDDRFKKRVVYQSDNIQDCIDQLDTIITIKKYNI